MKNTKTLLIILGVLLIAGAAFTLFRGSSSTNEPLTSLQTTNPSSDLQEIDGSSLNGVDSDLDSLDNETSSL